MQINKLEFTYMCDCSKNGIFSFALVGEKIETNGGTRPRPHLLQTPTDNTALLLVPLLV